MVATATKRTRMATFETIVTLAISLTSVLILLGAVAAGQGDDVLQQQQYNSVLPSPTEVSAYTYHTEQQAASSDPVRLSPHYCSTSSSS